MADTTLEPTAASLRARLGGLMLRDERRLRRRLDRARGTREPERRAARLQSLVADVERAEQVVARRRADVPSDLRYPEDLPITAAREAIGNAIEASQVVVVAGETGSGKTTQLPKICLELGRGLRGQIGHTQPRRIAARSVAARIAEELGADLGAQVGYQVRFSEQVSDRTLLKVMTDGILLAEIQRDPALRAYDTIIIDEAHERSLNIDFLLGYLHQLLPRRPDLKLLVTSATIDVARFSAHFGDAPIIEVSGRSYPVEVRYRPLTDPDGTGGERDEIQGISDAVGELVAEGPGDILVFCSGEREIRDARDALRGLHLRDTEILPLFGRLSIAEQQRVFQPHSGRRIVLATNVAETSLTVPGIHYVVDPGTARISRYSNRTKVQRLPIEKVSQASADQRKGRCGRVAEGICIRLYDADDFRARPEYTDPEILRTNLAAVILQMTALGLGDVAAFGFIDPPDQRSVRDAVQLLYELGAVDTADAGATRRLTRVGRSLATLPVDPRLGRMLIEAEREGCLREVLVIVAALSIQDPRQRPSERAQHADELHRRFADKTSDFIAYLNLWEYLRTQQRALSSSAFRRLCHDEYLHYLRVREWQDVHDQLRGTCKDLGLRVNDEPAEPAAIHRSLLAGLLSHIGLAQTDGRGYLGARGVRFVIWPGSGLARSSPPWIVAAELVETSRPWARNVARIEPGWVESLAGHLIKRSHSQPHWVAERGAAMVFERVTLYGVPLVTSRKVAYAPLDPEGARELFIRHALVEQEGGGAGEWDADHEFLYDNRRLLAEIAELEDRTRRRDLVVDDEVVFAFYDERIPADVATARDFDAWWSKARKAQPDRLRLTRDVLLASGHGGLDPDAYPDRWRVGDLALALHYRFEPGAPDDGVTVDVPLAALNQVGGARFDWQVPGYREAVVTALIRGLPKDLRRRLTPVADVVRSVLDGLEPAPGGRRGAQAPLSPEPLVAALSRRIRQATGVVVPQDAWDLEAVPEHLRMLVRVVDGDRIVAADRDLGALQRRLAGAVRVVVADAADDLERRGQTSWPLGDLPRSVERRHDGHVVRGYPALVDEGSAVGVRVLLTESEQRGAMWQGTRRLLLLNLPPPVKVVHGRLSNRAKLALTRSPHGDVGALLADCAACVVDGLVADHGGPAWNAADFETLHAAVAPDFSDALLEAVGSVEAILEAAGDVEGRLAAAPPALEASLEDARVQLARLVYPGFVTAAGRRRLPDVLRYVQALAFRLDKLRSDPARDQALMARVNEVWDAYNALRRRAGPAVAPQLWEIRWQIEELRVSLFAQQLGTHGRVSERRIFRAIAAADQQRQPAAHS